LAFPFDADKIKAEPSLQAEAIAHTPSAMVQQTLDLSSETIADFARQVQDIVPA
jgi:hypothetical protein